jgi:hypothetical protein
METHSLDDAPRSGAPRRFSPDTQAQVTATACQLPRQQDGPSVRGSRAKPARRVVATYPDGLVLPGTVGGWLRVERLHPWRYRMWQHIMTRPRCGRARPAPDACASIVRVQGAWVGERDETTSTQAWEAIAAPDTSIAGAPLRQSLRSHQRGARQLIARWRVAERRVIRWYTARQRLVDFQHVLTMVLLPEAIRRQAPPGAVLIPDTEPTHAPKQLAPWIAAQH